MKHAMTLPSRKARSPLTVPLVALVAAAFVAASLVPTALAGPGPRDGPHRPEAADRPERLYREGPMDRVAGIFSGRGEPFTINATGSGTSQTNATYTIEFAGDGRAHFKTWDEDRSALRGKAVVHYRILDVNGTVVKEGEGRVKVGAHSTSEGEWKWHLESVKKKRGAPALSLHGTATRDGASLDLTGEGKVVFKLEGQDRATFVRLSVTGTLAKL